MSMDAKEIKVKCVVPKAIGSGSLVVTSSSDGVVFIKLNEDGANTAVYGESLIKAVQKCMDV